MDHVKINTVVVIIECIDHSIPLSNGGNEYEVERALVRVTLA